MDKIERRAIEKAKEAYKRAYAKAMEKSIKETVNNLQKIVKEKSKLPM